MWAYTGQPSYAAGESLTLHVSTDAPSVVVRIFRDGHRDGARDLAAVQFEVAGTVRHPIPPDASVNGCQWPATITWPLPHDWPSGGYLVTVSGTSDGRPMSTDAFFVLRPPPSARAPLALIAATYTWCAYNDWGGQCFYAGVAERGSAPARTLSLLRPWARGQLRLPVGAPSMRVTGHVPRGWAVRHPYSQWALATGHSHWAGSGGWAAYDGRMMRWLDEAGFDVDVLTQWDLDRDPSILDGYAGVITCGHDEYWTGTACRQLGEFIDGGGWHARFGGNIMWQVRTDWRAGSVTCWKFDEHRDPLATGAIEQRTGLLEGRRIDSSPVAQFGGSGIRGGYSAWGGAAPRGLNGFIVYRPEHWIFAGTDAYYGDVLGGRSGVLGYECDGVVYDIVDGLPHPRAVPPPLTDLTILALAPVSFEEEDHGNPGSELQAGSDDLAGITRLVLGADTPTGRAQLRYGAATVTIARRGRGTIVCAGSTGWPDALAAGDRQCAQVTGNVLRRILAVGTGSPAGARGPG